MLLLPKRLAHDAVCRNADVTGHFPSAASAPGISMTHTAQVVHIANSNAYILGHVCDYEYLHASSTSSSLSPFPRPEFHPGCLAITLNQLRHSIVQSLEPLTPEDILSAYCRAIEPWFPIVACSHLRRSLPSTWDSVHLDVALLCLSLLLLTTTPPVSAEDDNNPSKFKSLYLHMKSSLSLAEGLGVHSFLVLQTRTLVALFEAMHGLFPAACISIGATVRAAEAIEYQNGAQGSTSYASMSVQEKRHEALTMYGIIILDRYDRLIRLDRLIFYQMRLPCVGT